MPTVPTVEEVRRDIQALKRREAELLQAKGKLERNLAINRTETAKLAEQAKQEGRQSVIDKLTPILPSTTSSFHNAATRAVSIDVGRVIAQYQKKKK